MLSDLDAEAPSSAPIGRQPLSQSFGRVTAVSGPAVELSRFVRSGRSRPSEAPAFCAMLKLAFAGLARHGYRGASTRAGVGRCLGPAARD